jgi:predicted nicotinamide N-methyase
MLFAHFLWSAGLVIADRIECAHGSEDNVWSMQGQKVLELGAGVYLPSCIVIPFSYS